MSNKYNNAADELVAILQRRHPAYSTKSDTVVEARRFIRENAAELLNFTHPELHPERCEEIRNEAGKAVAG